jgi:hypothetical protein
VTVRLASVVVGGVAASWEVLGFTVVGGVIPLSNGAIELDGGAAGAVALRVDGVGDAPADIDGVPVLSGAPVPAVEHPNGCHELDHVVIVTPSIDVTSAAIERALGMPRRRIRETPSLRQAFHRFDEHGCIVELVERDDAEGPFLWGLVVNTEDLPALVARAGDLVGEQRAAVQPGRRITTVRSAAGLGCAVAFMSV